jgi:hypothetical protein
MMRVEDRFENTLGSVWTVEETRDAAVTPSPEGLQLNLLPISGIHYSNAQISDYYHREESRLHFNFRWRPPLRMTVTARAQVENQPVTALRGTAGFGFWNHPFSVDAKRLPWLPQSIWFFYSSPPNNMQFAHGVRGCGWKAATMDAAHWRAVLLTPFALPGALLMQAPRLYNWLWKPIQRTLKISERTLDVDLLAARHTYTIDWRSDGAVFAVDDEIVLETPFAPRGAAGFISWLDNRYLIATPQGNFGYGTLPIEQSQSLILEHVLIEGM